MNNYEKIMSDMSIDKLTELVDSDDIDTCEMCIYNLTCTTGCFNCKEGIKAWLQQEVKE